MERQPRAARRGGGVDRGVLPVRARIDRTAEYVGPELGLGKGIGAVDAQAKDRYVHNGLLSFGPARTRLSNATGVNGGAGDVTPPVERPAVARPTLYVAPVTSARP